MAKHNLAAPFAAMLCLIAHDQARALTAEQANEYFQMSLEELSDFRITSVSKREERLADAAASVYVITADAIRRSGAHSLPEALRLAPNLLVARIGAQQYAITARNFNSSSANKLLVMIDGRTVYTPLYSGVFWDAQAPLLPEIDRIEVISGPGGTIWGTNAVNGVINVITRDAGHSGGELLQASAGQDASGVAVRHGAALGEGHYRIYAGADRWRHTLRASGIAATDAWRRQQAGFRADWHGARGDVSLMGDLYRGTENLGAPAHTTLSGANLLLRWDRSLANGARLGLQAYLDHTGRDVPLLYAEALTTLDAEMRYTISQGGTETVLGGGYRVARDQVTNSAVLQFLPARRVMHWANLFAQRQIELAPGWRLIGGLRAESNDHTGVEWLPNVKLAWHPGGNQTLWAGLARVVRAPARLDTDFYAPGRTAATSYIGGPAFKSELANKLELGWRAMPQATLSWSATLFHSRDHRLRSVRATPLGNVLDNQIAAQTLGLEGWASWQPASGWTLEAGALVQRQRWQGPATLTPPGNDPRRQFSAGSKWNIGSAWELDLAARHVGALATPAVPAYTAVDLRLGWRLTPALDLRLSATDLFHRRGHIEFRSTSGIGNTNPIRFERSLALTLTVRLP